MEPFYLKGIQRFMAQSHASKVLCFFLLKWVREACASDGVPIRARYVSVDSVCQQGQVRAGIGKSNKLRT